MEKQEKKKKNNRRPEGNLINLIHVTRPVLIAIEEATRAIIITESGGAGDEKGQATDWIYGLQFNNGEM